MTDLMFARHFEEGLEQIAQNRYSLAEGFFRAALKLKPSDAGAWGNLALCLKERGDYREAIVAFTETMRLNPGNKVIALICISECEIALGNLEKAGDIVIEALNSNPNNAEVHSMASSYYLHKEDFALSIQMADQALALKPDLATAHLNRGWALLSIGLYNDALVSTLKAQLHDPENHQAYVNASTIYLELGDYQNTIRQVLHAQRIRPEGEDAVLNICKAYKELGQIDFALMQIRNIGFNTQPRILLESEILNELGKTDLAISSLKRALAFHGISTRSELKHSLGCLLLKRGELEEGWKMYESRLKYPESMPNNSADLSLDELSYNASDSGEGGLLVMREQGLGDEILFASILPDLINTQKNIILEADPRLHSLYKRSFGACARLISREESKPGLSIRKRVYLGSLGKIYRRSKYSFPREQVAYLVADQERAQVIRSELEKSKPHKVIGISWFSKGVKRQNRKKGVPLEQIISAIPNAENCTFIVLQYGYQERMAEIRDLSKRLPNLLIPAIDQTNDIDGLAAYIVACDSIICVSTSIAHLACALGKTTHVLLPYSAIWHWGLKPKTSDWHPTAKLYRQQRLDQWEEPLEELKQALL